MIPFRAVATPNFLSHTVDGTFQLRVLSLMGGKGAEPTMIVGDPDIEENVSEDEGATLRIPINTPEKVWAMRDDYPDGPVVTFLMPEDY